MGRNQVLLPRKLIFSRPMAVNIWLTGPSKFTIFTTTAASTTHDRKWGRYTMVWTAFFKNFTRISLSKMANAMAIRVPSTIFPTAITSVLVKTCPMSGSWNIY